MTPDPVRRSLAELVATNDPALPLLQSWMESATNRVELLPVEPPAGERTLLALQVTLRSMLGAIAFHTAGLLVDDGWLRILGAGGSRLPRDLATWNGVATGTHRLLGAMLVADDALGGFFAINGGAFEGPAGHVWYLAPDTLAWEDLGMGYSDWVHWALTGDLAGFYESMRWPGWQGEIHTLDSSTGISVYPFLFTAGETIEHRSRRPVPIEELWGLHAIDLPKKLSPT
jgi:hypothetical protein